MLKHLIIILCCFTVGFSTQAVIVEVPIPQLIGRYDSPDNRYRITDYDAGVQFKSINSIKIQITGSVVQPTQYRVRETGALIDGSPFINIILKPTVIPVGQDTGGGPPLGTNWIAQGITDQEQRLLVDHFIFHGGLSNVSFATDEIGLPSFQPGDYLKGVFPHDIEQAFYRPTDSFGELQFSTFPISISSSTTGAQYADLETFPILEVSNAQLFIDGIPVPEPSTFLIGSIITIGILFRRRLDSLE